MDLKETVAAAKAEGRSYGEYVTQAAPPVEVNVPPGLMSQKEKAAMDAPLPAPPEPAPASSGFRRTCPVCGKTFLAPTEKSRKKYCSPDCLKTAQYQRVRDRKAAKEAEPVPPEPEKAKPVPPQPERRRITFGDILDLLDRDITEVELRMGDDNITGAANSRLWRPLECMTVANIDADESGLTVWLEEES